MIQAKQSPDPFLRLKHVGYVMSQGPLNGAGNIEDFANYAKFQLCLSRHYLMDDPIWDKYTDEQILVEYFAERFSNDTKFKSEFESSIPGGNTSTDAFADWAESQIEKNSKETEERESEKLKQLGVSDEDLNGFEFEPERLGE